MHNFAILRVNNSICSPIICIDLFLLITVILVYVISTFNLISFCFFVSFVSGSRIVVEHSSKQLIFVTVNIYAWCLKRSVPHVNHLLLHYDNNISRCRTATYSDCRIGNLLKQTSICLSMQCFINCVWLLLKIMLYLGHKR